MKAQPTRERVNDLCSHLFGCSVFLEHGYTLPARWFNSVEGLTGSDGVYRMTLFSRRLDMARKSKLTQAAVKIGTAMGKADRTAHQIAKAGLAAKDELADIAAQINSLKRQLLKTKKRLQRALK
jgi:hypothetical protein